MQKLKGKRYGYCRLENVENRRKPKCYKGELEEGGVVTCDGVYL